MAMAPADGGATRAVCAQILGPHLGPVFAEQVASVAARLSAEEPFTRESLVAAFRSRRLLPQRLQVLCAEYRERNDLGADDDEQLALCFAASIYPRAISQQADTELSLRFGAFAGLLPELVAADAPLWETLLGHLSRAGRLPPGASAVELRTFLGELTDADRPELVGASRDEQLAGAALYLTTCYSELIRRMFDNWRRQAHLVRYLRRNLLAAPSLLVPSNPDRPNWGVVRKRLGELFPDHDDSCHDLAIKLEQDVRQELSATGSTDLEALAGLWERLVRDYLLSGYPYYAFEAGLHTWWKAFVARPPAPPAPRDNDRKGETISLGDLRSYREVYRLVRITFFPRQSRNPAVDNEAYRTALDALWYDRLEHELLPQPDIRPARVKELAARFAHLGEHAVNNLCHRLRMRIYAGNLARRGRLPNAAVLDAQPPGRVRRRERPLQHEAGIRTVIALCRVVPADEPLLGPFTAQVFLHPAVEPRHADPWDWHRYARELWWWIREDDFADALRRGVRSDSRICSAALDLISTGKLAPLWIEICNRKELSADAMFAGEAEAASWLDELMCAAEWRAHTETWLRKWRRESGLGHWLVPVWYLARAEGQDTPDIVRRLKVDDGERQTVERMVKELLGSCS